MKNLRFIFIIALGFLIVTLTSVAIGRPVRPTLIALSVGPVIFFGLMIAFRMKSVERELEERLRSFASISRLSQELELRVALIRNDSSYNTVTPMLYNIETGLWTAESGVEIKPTLEREVLESPVQELTPESRFARILKDNYPL